MLRSDHSRVSVTPSASFHNAPPACRTTLVVARLRDSRQHIMRRCRREFAPDRCVVRTCGTKRPRVGGSTTFKLSRDSDNLATPDLVRSVLADQSCFHRRAGSEESAKRVCEALMYIWKREHLQSDCVSVIPTNLESALRSLSGINKCVR